MRRRIGFLAAGALFTGLLLHPSPSAADDREMALACLAQAAPLVRAGGEPARAIGLLESALEFDPGLSDAWYLLSVVRRRLPAERARGLADLERAVRLASWDGAGAEAARAELAEEQLRSGRLEEALRSLRLLAPERASDPRLPALLGEALLGRSAFGEAEAVLSAALNRFPGDPRLLRLRARALEAGGRAAEARRLLDRALELQPAAASLLLERARLEPAAARRLELADRYREAGGQDPAGALLGLRSAPGNPQPWLERFLSWGGDRRLDLLAEAGRLLAGRPALLRQLEEAVRGFSGERSVDADGDGLLEERYLYEGGELAAWELDRNQDGRPEARAVFRGTAPAELVLGEEPAGRARLGYEPYPHLNLVELPAEEGPPSRAAWRLPPFQLSADLLQVLPSAGALPSRLALRRADWRPDPAALRRLAYLVEVRDGAGLLRRSATLAAGRPVEVREDLFGDGRASRRVQYREGLAADGRRDLDGDGRFEVREEYDRGTLVRLLWDEDGDGTMEYAETVGPEATGQWDYDRDGVFDRLEAVRRGRPRPAPAAE